MPHYKVRKPKHKRRPETTVNFNGPVISINGLTGSVLTEWLSQALVPQFAASIGNQTPNVSQFERPPADTTRFARPDSVPTGSGSEFTDDEEDYADPNEEPGNIIGPEVKIPHQYACEACQDESSECIVPARYDGQMLCIGCEKDSRLENRGCFFTWNGTRYFHAEVNKHCKEQEQVSRNLSTGRHRLPDGSPDPRYSTLYMGDVGETQYSPSDSALTACTDGPTHTPTEGFASGGQRQAIYDVPPDFDGLGYNSIAASQYTEEKICPMAPSEYSMASGATAPGPWQAYLQPVHSQISQRRDAPSYVPFKEEVHGSDSLFSCYNGPQPINQYYGYSTGGQLEAFEAHFPASGIPSLYSSDTYGNGSEAQF